ncbi:hypothetical protein Desdi_1102 [Desulfitobacterium dichloroeliminans LMG P-21439]|uniref:Uncharacterized protein n=1 Tax=Desulfitobacterium dichloroeliminans (strain LMG P-21439 / DCA1) TaxID=871963 RepID=L0F6P3_DESDL|nr:hypothetical protein Desdi_1102 [Desulfitobacterium dichloroeliminans LMG P-21439]
MNIVITEKTKLFIHEKYNSQVTIHCVIDGG